MGILDIIQKRLDEMPRHQCTCGSIGEFDFVGKGWSQYDEQNNPILFDILCCRNCGEIYSEDEYRKLPTITPTNK